MCWEPNRGVITFCTNICCAISFEGDDKISGLSFQIRRSWPFSHCSEPGATFLEAFCMRSTFPTYKCRMPNGEVFCKKTSNDERGEGKTVRIEEKIRCKQEQDWQRLLPCKPSGERHFCVGPPPSPCMQLNWEESMGKWGGGGARAQSHCSLHPWNIKHMGGIFPTFLNPTLLGGPPSPLSMDESFHVFSPKFRLKSAKNRCRWGK